MFSPWTMKGERPLSRFMHYAEGEAPQDRGVVCGSSIYSRFETGCFMPGSPRGTLQIPSRLLATQPWRSCLADHQGPELPALLGKATVMLPANYLPGHLVTWSIASNRLTKVDHNRLTYNSAPPGEPFITAPEWHSSTARNKKRGLRKFLFT